MQQEGSESSESRATTPDLTDTEASRAQTPPADPPTSSERAATQDASGARTPPPARRDGRTPYRLARAISYVLALPDPREQLREAARESCRAHTRAVLRREGIALEGRNARRTRRRREGAPASGIEEALRRAGIETLGAVAPVLTAANGADEPVMVGASVADEAETAGASVEAEPEPEAAEEQAQLPDPRPLPPLEPPTVYPALKWFGNGVFAGAYAFSQLRDL